MSFRFPLTGNDPRIWRIHLFTVYFQRIIAMAPGFYFICKFGLGYNDIVCPKKHGSVVFSMLAENIY